MSTDRLSHNWATERAVLGGLLLDSRLIPDVRAVLAADDFTRPTHVALYDLLAELHTRDGAVDVATLLDYVEGLGHGPTYGGVAYLSALPAGCPNIDLVEVYARKVRDAAIRRRLQTAAKAILEIVEEGSATTEEMLTTAARSVADIASGVGEQDWHHAGDVGELVVESMRVRREGRDPHPPIRTFLPELDEWTGGGFRRGNLVIVAARPGMAKTVVGLLQAIATAEQGYGAGFMSLEMPRHELVERALARLARVPMASIRGASAMPSEIDRAAHAVEVLRSRPLWISDRPGLTYDQLVGRYRALSRRHGQPGLLVVDYLQLMETVRVHGVSREQEVARISRGLKTLARAENLVVCALAQVNRNVESRGINDRRPGLGDLRESGALEQDADIILSPYRHEVYEPGNPTHAGKCEILILKQRGGRTGVVPCEWHGDYTSIESEAARREQSAETRRDRWEDYQ